MKTLFTSSLAIALLVGSGAAGLAASNLTPQLRVNGQASAVVKLGQPAALTITLNRAGGGVHKQFSLSHGKAMHLVAVSADLDSFAHVHPTLKDGIFHITANKATPDPDNQDAARMFVKPGRYFLFGEVTPTGQPEATPRFDVVATGPAAARTLRLDPVASNGTFRKYFTAKGLEGKSGDAYQVTLALKKAAHPPGMPMVTLDYDLQAFDGAARRYKPVTALENWMGMTGHAIVISAAGAKASDKVFKHLHAGHAGHGEAAPGGHGGHGGAAAGAGSGHGGHEGHSGHSHAAPAAKPAPTVSFMMMGADVPKPGIYKVWSQVKHQGKVLTFPFVVRM